VRPSFKGEGIVGRFFMSDVQFTSNDETNNTADQIATAVELVFARNDFDDACTILERLGIGEK
jgi:hypothetical protein